MNTLASTPAPVKSSKKPPLAPLSCEELKKIYAETEKELEAQKKRLGEIRVDLEKSEHRRSLELGGKALLRRLPHVDGRMWQDLSGRIAVAMTDERDQKDLEYYLSHRPTPEEQAANEEIESPKNSRKPRANTPARSVSKTDAADAPAKPATDAVARKDGLDK